MPRVAIEAGYFTIPDDPGEAPRLLGSRCPRCEEHFFPRRVVCAKCLHEGCDDVLLGPTGRLFTWTYVHVPLFAKKDGSVDAYGVGQVDLPEGPRIQAILLGGPDDFEIGMTLELDLEDLGPNRDGDDVVIYRFRPRRRSPDMTAPTRLNPAAICGTSGSLSVRQVPENGTGGVTS